MRQAFRRAPTKGGRAGLLGRGTTLRRRLSRLGESSALEHANRARQIRLPLCRRGAHRDMSCGRGARRALAEIRPLVALQMHVYILLLCLIRLPLWVCRIRLLLCLIRLALTVRSVSFPAGSVPFFWIRLRLCRIRLRLSRIRLLLRTLVFLPAGFVSHSSGTVSFPAGSVSLSSESVSNLRAVMPPDGAAIRESRRPSQLVCFLPGGAGGQSRPSQLVSVLPGGRSISHSS